MRCVRCVQSVTCTSVALRWMCCVSSATLRSLHTDRNEKSGCVVLVVFVATCSWESVRFFSDLCIHQPRAIGSVKD